VDLLLKQEPFFSLIPDFAGFYEIESGIKNLEIELQQSKHRS